MRIYTRTGDEGETSLYSGERISKAADIVEAYGTVDELNSQLGLCRSFNDDDKIEELCIQIQNDLHQLASDIATKISSKNQVKRITEMQVENLEKRIDELNEKLPALKNFILPGGTSVSASLHIARCVCRRAERRVLGYAQKESLNPAVLAYLNRLSDLLFTMARFANFVKSQEETIWKA